MPTRQRRQKLKPVKVFSPGHILKKELEARELTIDKIELQSSREFAELIKFIIEEKQEINLAIAQKLSDFLGISVQFWLNLENNYRKFLIE